ncbi:VIR protein [Plasmodium vivax]|uniref:VIR protein n=1 Tax=Plasmodium vivax TaxID=5855 RepID=A0A1G4E5W4_PLAVI|nr:VIR protein [Plasmodium vivax]
MDDINLDYLTSKKLYNQWSKEVKGTSYLSKCYYFTSVPNNLHGNISDLCRKLLRNLEDMEYGKNDEFYTCGRCKLLNYWLYDQVKKILISHPKINDTEIIKDLHAAWSKYKKYEFPKSGGFYPIEVEPKCKPDDTLPNLIDIDDKKNIYEHCLNYYEISKNRSSNECQKYKAYIQRKTSLYDKFEHSFPKNDTEKCPTYYNKCYSYNPKNILVAKNCPQDLEIAAVPVAKDAQGRTSTINTKEGEGPQTQQEERERLSSSKADEFVSSKGEKIDSAEKRDGLPEPSKELTKPSSEEGKTARLNQEEHSEEREIQVHMNGDGILPSQGNSADGLALPSGDEDHAQGDLATFPSSTNNPSNVTTIGLSLFGIASFSTILYKFTPLRSVFYKLIHKNKSPINHHHEVPEELLEYMITSGSNNRDNRPNYIAYHPA